MPNWAGNRRPPDGPGKCLAPSFLTFGILLLAAAYGRRSECYVPTRVGRLGFCLAGPNASEDGLRLSVTWEIFDFPTQRIRAAGIFGGAILVPGKVLQLAAAAFFVKGTGFHGGLLGSQALDLTISSIFRLGPGPPRSYRRSAALRELGNL